MDLDHKILSSIERQRQEIIELVQKLVSIPSNAGDEGELAKFIVNKFEKIGLQAYISPLGDVNGAIGPDIEGEYFLLNTHLDQAEPGEMADPYSWRDPGRRSVWRCGEGDLRTGHEWPKIIFGRLHYCN